MRRIRTVAALALMLTLMGSIHAQAQEVAQQDMEDHLNTCDPADYQQQLLDAWFDLLTPTIDGLSQAALLGDVWRIWSDVVKVDDITEDHGQHALDNTRYKEWWYFDAHTDDGLVVSASVVLSIVDPYYFLWVYDPATGQTEFILDEDDPSITVTPYGQSGFELVGSRVRMAGDDENGYVVEFDGDTMDGQIIYSDPIDGRAERHAGEGMTYYGLYQVPRSSVSGTLTRTGQSARAITGEGYHDHWWGIVNRYTKWEWVQAKMDNGWTVGFYNGHYGKPDTDIHRYAWLHRPGKGYTYFNENNFVFEEVVPGEEWRASISGLAGQLEITANARTEVFQRKRVELIGIPVGEVDYFQYPVTVHGTFRDWLGRETVLTSDSAMLEWDWDAVW